MIQITNQEIEELNAGKSISIDKQYESCIFCKGNGCSMCFNKGKIPKYNDDILICSFCNTERVYSDIGINCYGVDCKGGNYFKLKIIAENETQWQIKL